MAGSVNVLSLCTGYGGLELGLKRLGLPVRTIAVVEREGFAIANLVAKMEAGALDAAPIFTDVKTFPYADFRGCMDLLTAGYPCQPFSACGKRQGADDPRHLWPHIAKGIRFCRPGWVFCENVEGHISMGLSTVISDLEEMGYRSTWGIFSAAEVGAPHQRKRVFILAHDSSSRRQDRLSTQARWRERNTGESGGSGQKWPARPNEPQHRWEEPRVVADSGSQRRQQNPRGASGDEATNGGQPDGDHFVECEGQSEELQLGHTRGNSQGTSTAQERARSTNEGEREAERRLGRIFDERPAGMDPAPAELGNRIDRLRLLGNGVVPATASKAFATLYEELMSPAL